MESVIERASQDVSNIVHLEHVNVTQPDQQLAISFYVTGLGLTRDPYMMVGTDNMWINIGRSQMHLPTGNPQRIRGTIGLVVPDLGALKQRLNHAAAELSPSLFSFVDRDTFIEVTCPWGNRFRCHAPAGKFGRTDLAMPYVEFNVPAGTADRIARFYREVMGAACRTAMRYGSMTASVSAGREQYLFFRETDEPIPPYDGHHIQIYIADFSGPHRRLLGRSLLTRDTDAHEWRFTDIVDLDTNEVLFRIEHEVRSLKHPLYARPLVNRNPAQSNLAYIRGKDAFDGTF
jgi:predicted enzyme related to lactoylglutathione lyase